MEFMFHLCYFLLYTIGQGFHTLSYSVQNPDRFGVIWGNKIIT